MSYDASVAGVLNSIGPTFLALVVSLLLIWLLSLGRFKKQRWTTGAVIFVAIFGVAGVLATTPLISSFQAWLIRHISGGTSNAGGGSTAYIIIIVLAAVIGIVWYAVSKSAWSLVGLIVLTLPILAYPSLHDIAGAYSAHFAEPVSRFLVGFVSGA